MTEPPSAYTGADTAAETAAIAPFGAFAPTPFQNAVRAAARALPKGYMGRKIASALLGPAGGRSNRAFDVTVFGTARARLHPHDNICEKRVYLTPQFWDADERAHLADAITTHTDETFYFLDVGANVGLYTLFARSVARATGNPLRAACIEPANEMRRRLSENLALSDAGDSVRIMPYAATATDGPVGFLVNTKSRGMSQLSDADSQLTVDGKSLHAIIKETGFPRIDAMKIDIEGYEHQALKPFFESAAGTGTETPVPRLIIIEKSHDASCDTLLRDFGYQVVLENALNNIYQLPTDRRR
ncbi:MAG: FkbM family methyltransferase [Pseudomonadota bacterium]